MRIAKVNEMIEFREIMNNFTNVKEIIREAIQNAVDAGGKNIIIDIRLEESEKGVNLIIVIEDDGEGLPVECFENFFDLGNSTKKGNPDKIGDKGHGTKTYCNSERITVESFVNYKKYLSIMDSPYAKIFKQEQLEYTDPIEVENVEGKQSGLRVTIEGYLKNATENCLNLFSHPPVKDYIQWFTAFGSIEGQFNTLKDKPVILLRTYDSCQKVLQEEFNFRVDENNFEQIEFGHLFPEKPMTSKFELKKLAKEIGFRNWQELFCKRLICKEIMIDGLEEPVQLVIWVEGDKCKRLYNPLIRERVNSNTRDWTYKVQDRYGFWACKNGIPIQKVDIWISGKGTYTKFHGFINYNKFSLTANRSSIDNTSPSVINKIREKVDQIVTELMKDEEYKEWQDIEEQASNERSAEAEETEFALRLKKCLSRKKVKLGNVVYYEPHYEGETAMLLDGVMQVAPDYLPYEILDYNVYRGIDYLVRENKAVPLEHDNTVGYLELKYNLVKGRFNHSFHNLRGIVCFDKRGMKVGQEVTDLLGKRLLVQKVGNNFVLADFHGEVGHSIKVFVLKDFLESSGYVME